MTLLLVEEGERREVCECRRKKVSGTSQFFFSARFFLPWPQLFCSPLPSSLFFAACSIPFPPPPLPLSPKRNAVLPRPIHARGRPHGTQGRRRGPRGRQARTVSEKEGEEGRKKRGGKLLSSLSSLGCCSLFPHRPRRRGFWASMLQSAWTAWTAPMCFIA